MIIRKLRLERGWSQEQLAELCNLSVRTIQRIERGQKPSLESQKSLAAVFDVEVSQLSMETTMNEQAALTSKEEKALLYVRDIKAFYSHCIKYGIVISFLFVINLLKSPDHFWVIWPALGWGIGLLFHGLNVFEVFNFLGPDWERQQVEKRMKNEN